MCIGIEQYRMIVGLFKHYLKNRHVLTYKDFFCINLIIFARNKSYAVGIAIFINFFINLSPQVKQSKSETVSQNIKVNGSDVVLDRICFQIIHFKIKTILCGPLSLLKGVWNVFNFIDSSVWLLFNQDSENDKMSKSSYSAAMRSNLGIILWIFKWRNETDDENLSQKLETSIEFKDQNSD
jgi:hypothetical protein